jgi:hypothetical protein
MMLVGGVSSWGGGGRGGGSRLVTSTINRQRRFRQNVPNSGAPGCGDGGGADRRVTSTITGSAMLLYHGPTLRASHRFLFSLT